MPEIKDFHYGIEKYRYSKYFPNLENPHICRDMLSRKMITFPQTVPKVPFRCL